MASLNNKILHDYGGTDTNNLRIILNDETEYDDNSATIIQASNYHDTDEIIYKLKNKQNQFKILGLNAESLASKIDHISSRQNEASIVSNGRSQNIPVPFCFFKI